MVQAGRACREGAQSLETAFLTHDLESIFAERPPKPKGNGLASTPLRCRDEADPDKRKESVPVPTDIFTDLRGGGE